MAIARKPNAKSNKSNPGAEILPPEAAEGNALSAETDPVLPVIEEAVEATLDEADAFQEQVRRAAEESFEQTKRIYERLKAAAQETSTSVEATLTTVSKGVSEINMKTIDALKVNSDAQFAFIKALFATKTISEAIALQGEHARIQFETLHAQVQEIGALIQQVSTDSIEPIRTSITRNLQNAA